MGWDGNGNVTRTNGTNTGNTVWTDDRDADIKIRSDLHDTHDEDLAGAIERCLNLDGENQMAANLRMGGFKLVNAAEGSSADEMSTVGQSQRQIQSVSQASGTDALKASYSPAIPSLEDKLTLYVRANAANTSTTPTFSPNGLSTKTIVKNGNAPLFAGDIAGQYHVLILQYRSADDVWELLNPASPFPNLGAQVTADEAELNKLDGIGSIVEEGDSPNLEKINLNNNEQGDHDDGGDVYFDASVGLYVKAHNSSGDQSGGNLLWSSGNFTAGNALSVSYGAEDEPTLSVSSNSIAQSELKTDTGTVSVTDTGGTNGISARRTLPGGQYGFTVETRGDTDGGGASDYAGALVGMGTPSDVSGTDDTLTVSLREVSASIGSYATYVLLFANERSGSGDTRAEARQRYIQSSPPYDLGDGECGLFVEVDVLPDKRIGGLYVAADPIWANNGPTDIRPDWIDPKTGKKYKRIRKPALCREDLETGKCDMEDYVAAQREAPVEDVEIDGAYKNADMGVIPHSWSSYPQGTICLLDPVNTHDLLALHQAGEDVADLIHRGYIKIGDECNRYGPPGVKTVTFKWSKR